MRRRDLCQVRVTTTQRDHHDHLTHHTVWCRKMARSKGIDELEAQYDEEKDGLDEEEMKTVLEDAGVSYWCRHAARGVVCVCVLMAMRVVGGLVK